VNTSPTDFASQLSLKGVIGLVCFSLLTAAGHNMAVFSRLHGIVFINSGLGGLYVHRLPNPNLSLSILSMTSMGLKMMDDKAIVFCLLKSDINSNGTSSLFKLY